MKFFYIIIIIIYRVTCLEMSPMDDLFLSSSIDQTIRLWDTRTPVCQVNIT